MDPKETCEDLMNEGIGFAAEMLGKHGEFYPYGMVRSSEGEVSHAAVDAGEEYPDPTEVAQMLVGALKQQANHGEIEAAAMFINVTVRDNDDNPQDAVQVALEHQAGYAISVVFPYEVEGGEVTWGEIFAVARDPEIFSH